LGNWAVMKIFLSFRFGSVEGGLELRRRLYGLRQGRGSVSDYVASYRSLLLDMEGDVPTELDLILHFSKGLQNSVRNYSLVEPSTRKPWTFFDTMAQFSINYDESLKIANASENGVNDR
jgi:hypothetical protein